jgi:hypothetical protein
MYVRPGRDSAGDADPPLGVSSVDGDPGATLTTGIGVSTPGTAPDISTD